MSDEPRVLTVGPGSPLLASIRQLWRRNSATLGFFPDGALQESAHDGRIIAAVAPDDQLLGYLLFRLSGSAAVIVHLCVDDHFRGTGVARLLLEALKKATVDCTGVRLSCRADFAANAIWPRLGFEPRADRPAREYGRNLKSWWYDYGKPDLFSGVREDLPLAVLDANVFFDLQDPEGPATLESQTLTADWLQDLVQLAISGELFIEIDRNDDPMERTRRRQFTSSFKIVRPNRTSADSVFQRISNLLGDNLSETGQSDAKHLSHAVAAGATYFVTRDDNVLKHGEQLFDAFGVTILRPSQLVSLSDEELNGASYQPARLAGSRLVVRRPRGSELSTLADAFLATDRGERKSDLLRLLTTALSLPATHSISLVSDAGDKPLALVVTDKQDPARDVIVAIRVARVPIAATLARHLVWRAARDSVHGGREFTSIVDSYASGLVAEALRQLHFDLLPSDVWTKRHVRGAYRRANFAHTAQIDVGPISDGSDPVASRRLQASLEATFWPAKILDGALETFLVPIQAHWAMHLFDERSAGEDLFGAETTLILSAENVYYRAARPFYPTAPSRVVWYVSGSGRHSSTLHAIGCSLVNGVYLGSAQELYRRFRRLGVYEWKDVRQIAKGSAEARIMAFTFTQTELFPLPIPWRTLKNILYQHQGRVAPIQCPIRLTAQAFEAIYAAGNLTER